MKRIAAAWDNLKLRTKFLLILALAMTTVCVSTLLASRLPYHAYDDQLYSNSTQLIALFADRVQADLDDIESQSFQIIADNMLQSNLLLMASMPAGSATWVNAKANVGARMSYISTWFTSAIAVQLKTTGGTSFVEAFGTSFTVKSISEDQEREAAAAEGKASWIVGGGDPAELYITRQVRQIERLTLEPLATLVIQIDLKNLIDSYCAGMSESGHPLRCAVYAQGKCLYAGDQQIREISEDGRGYEPMTLNEQPLLCVRYTSANGWKYVTLVDYTQISATIRSASGMTIAIVAAVALLMLTLSAWLITSVLRHLGILLEKFDAFALTGRPVPKGDSPYRQRKDEIGKLHRHFDRMTRDYDRMTQDNAEQQRLLQEKQIQQLRAQVRPHFLYNTLESIYCLAQSAKDDRIATMTDALGKMLRASLNDKRDVITIGEDLQLAKEYLRIQLIRYGDRLRVEYDVSPSLMDCRIPTMTLQPLVENAVHHAAEEMLDECVIHISGAVVQDGVNIIVEDNGPGIDEDILRKLESGEAKPEGLGIGMRNIHKRVQYAFSEAYGLQVKSCPHHTQIIVRLPDTRIR